MCGIVWGANAKPPVWYGFAATRALMLLRRKCVMAGRVNWSSITNRDRIRRQGVEDIKGKTPVVGQPRKQPRRKWSKAELREQAAAAFLAWRAGQTSKDK
jgi:hypothetical protein